MAVGVHEHEGDQTERGADVKDGAMAKPGGERAKEQVPDRRADARGVAIEVGRCARQVGQVALKEGDRDAHGHRRDGGTEDLQRIDMPRRSDECEQRIVHDSEGDACADDARLIALRGEHAEEKHEREFEDWGDAVGDAYLLFGAAEGLEDEQRQVHHSHGRRRIDEGESREVREQVGAGEGLPQGNPGRRLRGRGWRQCRDVAQHREEKHQVHARGRQKHAPVRIADHDPCADGRADGPCQCDEHAKHVHVEWGVLLGHVRAADDFAGVGEEL